MLTLLVALLTPAAHAECYAEVIADPIMTEYDAGQTGYTIFVSLQADDVPCQVSVEVYELPPPLRMIGDSSDWPLDSAEAHVDFEPTRRTFGLQNDTWTTSFDVIVYDDLSQEGDEQIGVTVTGGPDVTIAPFTDFVLTIEDDDDWSGF